MDKRKSLINVGVSVSTKIAVVIVGIFVRRYLISCIGNEFNGLYSLYIGIVGFLSVAELGVGTAITFCMYAPVVAGDTQKVAALYRLFRKLYYIVCGVILALGCAVMPLLPYLISGTAPSVNLYLTFALMLVSVAATYLYGAKLSLFNAYKNNFISTAISAGGQILQDGLQIVVLLTTHSFEWYLACRIFAVAAQWLVTEVIARVRYGDILKLRTDTDRETKTEVMKNIKAMFCHKIGSVLVGATDSILISAFIGVVILGKYSNYTAITASMANILNLLFTSLTSVVGHMCIQDGSSAEKYFRFFHGLNFAVGCLFYLGYYAVCDQFVQILFGEGLELPKAISFVISLNYFVQYMRQSVLMFRDATGTFYYDRFKPLVEGIANLALSIGFVFLFRYAFGEEFAVVGVIAATVLTNLFICHIVEPLMLYKHCFHNSPCGHYLRFYAYMGGFVVALVGLNFCLQTFENVWAELFVNGAIAVAFALVLTVLAVGLDPDLRRSLRAAVARLKNRRRKERKHD